MNDKTVNVAIQVLPFAKDKNMYDLVDAAIEKIQHSGLKYRVTPFETVVEGKYADVMALVAEVQNACYMAGSDSLLCNLKIQSHSIFDVSIEDKTGKYDQ